MAPVAPLPLPPPAPGLSTDQIIGIVTSDDAESDGVFVQVVAGPAIQHLSVSGADLAGNFHAGNLDTAGVSVGALVGAWLTPRLVLAGEVAAATTFALLRDDSLFAVNAQDVRITSLSAGARFSYHFTGRKSSVFAALLMTKIRLVDPNGGALLSQTGLTPALELGATRDFWTHEDWGVGIGVHATANLPRNGSEGTTYGLLGLTFGVAGTYY